MDTHSQSLLLCHQSLRLKVALVQIGIAALVSVQ